MSTLIIIGQYYGSKKARVDVTIPEHKVHELQPLPAQEAVAVGGLHERAAQRVEHVLHSFLLFSPSWVVTFVELGGNTTIQ